MLKNYLKIAIRNIFKQKIHSLIHVWGLAVGIALFILVFLFVHHEFGYDKFNEHYDRIYRIGNHEVNRGYMAPAIGEEIDEVVTEIEKVARITFRPGYVIQYTDEERAQNINSLSLRAFAWCDGAMFDIFSLPFILGDPKTALSDPWTIVLTESTAERLFGDRNPLGETLRLNMRYDLKVTGVMKDPQQFHLNLDALGSYPTLIRVNGESYAHRLNGWDQPTYVLMRDKHDVQSAARKITEHFHDRLYKLRREDVHFFLFPLKDIYFQGFGHWNQGNLGLITILIVIAAGVLLLACINFINLSTARSALRAREIGLRKVIGSSRRRIIIQFLCESVLYSLTALGVGFLLAYFLLPMFNGLMQKSLSLSAFRSLIALSCLLSGGVLVGLIAGAYPSFYLSSFQPVAVLRGEKTKGSSAILLRQILIVFQFAISTILLVGTFTVYRQIQYMKKMDLGFEKERIIQFNLTGDARQNKEVLKNKLRQHPGILEVTYSHGYPGQINNWESFFHEGKRHGFAALTVDPDFFKVYQFEVIAGRLFDSHIRSDEFRTCVLNEAAVREFGLANPVGTVFHREREGGSAFSAKDIEVIGVVRDFHFQSMHENIGPLIFGWNTPWTWNASVRISSNNIEQTIRYIRDACHELMPGFAFEYHFLDEYFDRQYRDDERFGRMISYITLIGVFIACLGLLGLVSFVTMQRAREVGIRKVLGASIPSILSLLSKEFLKWIMAASILSWPISFYFMNKWLQNFAYRTSLSIWIFMFSGLAALVIALLSVSWQTIKSAIADPVQSLRYE